MGTSLHLLVEHLATQPDHPPVEHTTRKRERETGEEREREEREREIEMTSDGEKVTYCCSFKMSINITFC